jgi:aerotolerance regulator-like protein
MDFFLHPAYMVAGGALVSAPILIHLINRMRFKRIRWAAMEFLLKSQKRNRRRLIIEQLILLMLRILLVLLTAFLVARYVFAGYGEKGTLHVVVMDDTPSMGDRHRNPQGQDLTAFDVGKEQLDTLIHQALQANSPQQMVVYLLSDLDTPVFDQRLSDASLDQLKSKLDGVRAGAVHIDPLLAVVKARELFSLDREGRQHVLHFVSDFRDIDWATGPGVEKLTEEIDKLLDGGANLSLIDAAHPYRRETKGVVLDHGNVAILDLRAESRLAAEAVPIEFTATIANYGSAPVSPFLKVSVDGQQDFVGSRPVDKPIEAGAVARQRFQLLFVKKRPAVPVQDKDRPEERERKRLADREYFHVSAEIEGENAGLRIDNVRDMVIEVRRRVPTLLVDGGGPESRKEHGDSYHVEAALSAARAYEVERRTPDELETTNLDLYPSIFLLNVPRFKSEKTVAKLKAYVNKGGSLAWFVGDKVQADYYNETLFREGGGIFPLLLTPRPTEPLTPEEREERLQRDEQPKILFPDKQEPPEGDPIRGLWFQRPVFRYLLIQRYWPAQPRFQWDPEKKETRELIVLPNRKPMDDYKQPAQELVGQALQQTRDLANADPEMAKYIPELEKARREVIVALGTPYLGNLVTAIDRILNDPGNAKEPVRPALKELWAHGKLAGLQRQLQEFHDQILYGDPFVVSRRIGNGKVVACLTTAGTASNWNDWGGGSEASWTYPMFLMDLQRYLSSEGDDLNRFVGDSVVRTFDAARYKPEVKATFQPQPDPDAKDERARRPGPVTLGTFQLASKENTLIFTFNNSRKPGVYTFEFTPLGAGGVDEPPEVAAYAFNVDAARESDLKRAAKERLERVRTNDDSKAGKITLRSTGDSFERFRNRQPDASESPWLYLFFILVLVAEQAMAVHLSFHLKGNELAPLAAAGRVGPAAA